MLELEKTGSRLIDLNHCTLKLAVILNGSASKRNRYQSGYHQLLASRHVVTVFETRHAGDGGYQTLLALAQKPDAVLAAGGDGTLNQVINALLETESKVPVAIAPLGTGNDFAAVCGIKNVHDLLEKLSGQPLPTDAGIVSGQKSTGERIQKYFINVASIGLGPDVAHYLEKSKRMLGPDLTYVLNSVRAFLRQVPFTVEAQSESWNWSGKIRALAIANGVRFGSGLHIAPGAKIDDGLFSVFVAGDVPLHEFLYFLIKIKGGQKIRHSKAIYNSCQNIILHGPEGTWLETDGELALQLPAELQIKPGALLFFR
jgi:YegS/Rv2252/BmrU family lipid kinase